MSGVLARSDEPVRRMIEFGTANLTIPYLTRAGVMEAETTAVSRRIGSGCGYLQLNVAVMS
jgi:hypothetical protein